MYYSKNLREGFTLVEIMIVVGIIVLLAALAVPAWQVARKRAVTTRMDSDVGLLAHAAQQYALEYQNETLPFGYDSATGAVSGPLGDHVKIVNRGYVFAPSDQWDAKGSRTVSLPAFAISHTYDGSGRRAD